MIFALLILNDVMQLKWNCRWTDFRVCENLSVLLRKFTDGTWRAGRKTFRPLSMFLTEQSVMLESRQCIVDLVSVKTILKYKEAAFFQPMSILETLPVLSEISSYPGDPSLRNIWVGCSGNRAAPPWCHFCFLSKWMSVKMRSRYGW